MAKKNPNANPDADETQQLAEAEVTIYGPEGSGDTLCHAGEVYEAEKDGSFKVPPEAVDALRSHGYTTDKPAKAGK